MTIFGLTDFISPNFIKEKDGFAPRDCAALFWQQLEAMATPVAEARAPQPDLVS
jgi:hypothetical protein